MSKKSFFSRVLLYGLVPIKRTRPIEISPIFSQITEILRTSHRKHGIIGLIWANLLLFAPYLVFITALSTMSAAPWAKILRHIAGGLLCMVRFEVMRRKTPAELLKLAFILSTAIFDASWPLTYLFMSIFENILATFIP